MARAGASGIPTEVLVVPGEFGGAVHGEFGHGEFGGAVPEQAVAEALQRGLVASGQPARVSTLADPDYDAQMRAARALITGTGTLDRRSLHGTVLAEVATRARQAGVPCHAVVGVCELDLFDLRILDLQLVLEAQTLAAIEAAGAEIGAAIRVESASGG